MIGNIAGLDHLSVSPSEMPDYFFRRISNLQFFSASFLGSQPVFYICRLCNYTFVILAI